MIKKIVNSASKYWYMFYVVFCILEILNYGVLSDFVSEKICFWVSSFLFFVIAVYTYFLSRLFCDNVYNKAKDKYEELSQTICDLKIHIDELDSENKELSNKLSEFVREEIKTGNAETVRVFQNDIMNCAGEIVAEMNDTRNEIRKISEDENTFIQKETDKLLDMQQKSAEIVQNIMRNTATDLEATIKEKNELLLVQIDNLKNQDEKSANKIITKIADNMCKTTTKLYEIHNEEINVLNQNKISLIEAIRDNKENATRENNDNKSAITAIDEKIDKIAYETGEKNLQSTEKISLEIATVKADIAQMIFNEREKATEEHAESLRKVDYLANKQEAKIDDVYLKIEEFTQSNEKQINDVKLDVLGNIDKVHNAEIYMLNQNNESLINTIRENRDITTKEVLENRSAIMILDEKLSKIAIEAGENNLQSTEKISLEIGAVKADIAQMISGEREKSAEEHAESLQRADCIANKQEAKIDDVYLKLEELTQSSKKQLDNVNESVLEKISKTSAEEVDIIKSVGEKMGAVAEEHFGLQKEQIDNLSLSFNKKVDSVIEIQNKELLEIINSSTLSHSDFKEYFENYKAEIELKSTQLYSTIYNCLNGLIDNVDENAEKNQRYIDLLNNQVMELSKNNKKILSDVLSKLENNKEQLLESDHRIITYVNKQERYNEEYEERFREHIENVDMHYAECFRRLTHMQAEVSSVVHAMKVLNSVYSLLQGDKKDLTEQSLRTEANRVEEYKDSQSGAIVKNHYKNHKISYSEMIVDGKKTYDVQYNPMGKVLMSRSYNKDGTIVLEVEFYENGQVKTRKEHRVSQGKKETVVSRFDERGNKLK